ncbi:MAG: dolichol-phosphate mannosyltransferase [Patescibacteria group bacterium]|nr:MAG: dolichol-phosphate mannosyltransferase [Patescibacteria group bacterium]
MKKIRKISLVIPTYNQEKTIIKNLRLLKKSLDELPYAFELLVVVDGFGDKTYQILKKIRQKNLQVLGYKENKGKGFALKHGMLNAQGDVIGFIDGDLDIHPEGIAMLINHMIWYNADIIVGSKLHPVSQVNYPRWRKILSWGYRSLIRLLFGLKVRDTQVGIKLFKRKVVRDVFPLLVVKRFAFDVEVLAVANHRGFSRIYEAPIRLQFNNASSITNSNFWKIILLMLWDTFAIFYRLHIIRYYERKNLQ